MILVMSFSFLIMCLERHKSSLIDNCEFQGGVPTSESRENVRVQCILYRSLCGYTSVRYLVVCDIRLIARSNFGAQEALERRLQMIFLELHPSET